MSGTVLALPRFWAKVVEGGDPSDPCWLWTAAKTPGGYGTFRLGGRHGRDAVAHRLTYSAMRAEVPPGLDLDHLCRARACVNPYHLEPVPRAVNLARGAEVGGGGARFQRDKSACPQGHPYPPSVPGRRRTCAPCHAASQARYLVRQKERA